MIIDIILRCVVTGLFCGVAALPYLLIETHWSAKIALTVIHGVIVMMLSQNWIFESTTEQVAENPNQNLSLYE